MRDSLLERLTTGTVLIQAETARKSVREACPSFLQSSYPLAEQILAAFSEQAPFLWRLALHDVRETRRLFKHSPEKSLNDILRTVTEAWRTAPDAACLMQQMRRLRCRHALLVALADCGGIWDLNQVTRALTDFADASVSCAIRYLLNEAAKAGRFIPPVPEFPDQGCGLAVLALGKHGAGELNYSSDIDVVLFYDPQAPLSPKQEPGAFFVKIAQGLVKLLQERTPDGYVHRVDLRLRPDPGSTAPAVSLPAAFSYYESFGQNWERAAFIKARAVAGDLNLGRQFLSDLSPFIWRKYFDFSSIADVHAMKRQIHAVKGHETIAVAGHDIKLGRGGIREIEFFVQTQQLVYGGRRTKLRGSRTLEMLQALRDEGWITQQAQEDLTAAYTFLRTIEHRLQMRHDEQTQRLPDDPEDLERFAKFCGFISSKNFANTLIHHAKNVERHYALLFEEGPTLATDVGDLVFTGSEHDPATLETLIRLGFKKPEEASETIRGWHFGRRSAVTSARAREVLTELTPALLKALSRSANPDQALLSLDAAFGRMPASVELMTMLLQNDKLLQLFADLLGSAPRLAHLVAASPHVLDVVIDPAFAGDLTKNDIEKRIQTLSGAGTGLAYEVFLDRIRDAVRQTAFLISARMISGMIAPRTAGQAFTDMADATICACLDEVCEVFAQEHGQVPDGALCVLGLGRLGSREMTSTSDLDLVVLYDFNPDQRTSDGAKPLDAAVYYARITQRLISALTVPTRRGRLYEVDLRLRPSGKQGPIASTLASFIRYQMEEAETWEHMALSRARPIAGERELQAKANEALRNILSSARNSHKLRNDISEMRELVNQIKGAGGPWDIKNASGGLIDIDFVLQYFILANPRCAIVCHSTQSTEAVLDCAVGSEFLSQQDAELLQEASKLFTEVLHWQRLSCEGRMEDKPETRIILDHIAHTQGLPDRTTLLAHMNDIRAKIQALVTCILA